MREQDGEPGPWGIVRGHRDGLGHWTPLSEATRRQLIEAMGGDPDGEPPQVEVASGDEQVSCHPPPRDRVWGLSVQLYAARSRASWGIGDLADLRTLGSWAAGRGARVLLVNPLDAVAPVTPRQTSPYTPTTRRFLDPIYLAIREVPGAADVDLDDLAERGRALNAERLIDRDAVWELKQEALRRIWAEVPAVRRDPASATFREEHAPTVDQFAAYVLAVDRYGPDVHDWPEELRSADGDAVRELAASDEAAFHVWQQFCLDRQLAAAGEAIGLLRDLPVGFDPKGFDAWTWRELLATGVTIGAPPDQLGPQGQDWELPAFVPWKLAHAGFEPLRQTLAAELRHAAGLRIDHVLGLFRLFWIPPGGTPAEGAYVRQPTDALLNVVARASREAGTWIVGEDLGTVEEGVRPALLDRDVFRYQVLWFEQDEPAAWSPRSLASITTHDVATVAGMWTGRDLELQREVGLEPDEEWSRQLRSRLARDADIDPDAPADEAAVALHRHVARAASRVVVAQVEDLLGVVERPNVPGTRRDQRPANWSLALPVPIDDLPEHDLANRVVDALRQERPGW